MNFNLQENTSKVKCLGTLNFGSKMYTQCLNSAQSHFAFSVETFP